MTAHSGSGDRNARIAALAYKLWEEQGRPHGKSEEHWHHAARLVDADVAAKPIHAQKGPATRIKPAQAKVKVPIRRTAPKGR